MTDSISCKQLAEWIVDLETGEKRGPALVMELCLAEYLLPACSVAMGIAEYSCGWFHVSVGNARHWFRVLRAPLDQEGKGVAPSRPSHTERVFIGRLASLGHRFFAVTLKTVGRSGTPPAPHLGFAVGEWCAGGTPEYVSSPLAQAYAADLAKTVNDGIMRKIQQTQRFPVKNEKAIAARTVLVDMMGAQKTDVLELLLATRCLMNFGFAAPVDADALALDLAHEPVLLEFKRKYPSSGRQLTRVPASGKKLVADALEADARVRGLGKNPGAGKTIFDGFADESGLTETSGDGYGLDMSHLRTLLMCEQAGTRYRYLIWRSDKEAAGHGRSKDGFHPEKLLWPTLVPLAWPDLKWKDISAAYVTGITCTDGDGSGAFTRGVRVQAVFDANDGYQVVGAPPGFVAHVITECPVCHSPVRTKWNGRQGCSNYRGCNWYEA